VVKLPPEKVVILATGAQGEPSAVLGRLAHGKHRWITLTPGDTVIISAHPIPGNEEMVNRTINRLFQRGADVLYDPIAPVHVSGHASQEEQKLLLNLIRPKFFIPVHGELRHLKQHAKIAMELGIPREHIAVVENGYVIELDRDSITVGERVPGGYVFVDGSSVGEVTPAVIRDRETLARDGIVIAVVPVDPTGHVTDRPEIISRGFVRAEDSDELLEGAREAIIRSVNGYGRSPDALRLEVEEVLSAYLYSETKRRPMVFAVVTKA
jgi:ribonuclease J